MCLSDTEKLVIKTLANYVLTCELVQNKIVKNDAWEKHYESLTDIQKEIVAIFESEKNNILEKIQNKIKFD